MHIENELRTLKKNNEMKKVIANGKEAFIASSTTQDFGNEMKHRLIDKKGNTVWFNGQYSYWNDGEFEIIDND